MNKETGIKFIKLVAKDYKGIDVKIVKIEGRNLAIFGGNETQKSTLMQIFKSVASSKYIASEPIMKGKKRAETSVTIEGKDRDGKEVFYNIGMYFTLGNQRGKLVITDRDGNTVDKPSRKMVDDLVNYTAVPIDAFLRKSSREQAKDLKDLTGRGAEIDALDEKIKKAMEDRLHQEKKFKEQEALLKNHGYTPEQVEAYSKPVDLAPIEQRLAELGPKMEEYTRIENGVAERKQQIIYFDKEQESRGGHLKNNLDRIQKLKEEIRQLDEANKILEKAAEDAKLSRAKVINEINNGEIWLSEHEKPDNTAIAKELSDGKLHNQHHDTILKYQERQKEMMASKELFKKLDTQIGELHREKAQVIASSNLPVEGLGFDEDGVYLNGLPFEPNQINTATRLHIGEEIMMAKNPTLKCLFVEEGSLYDRASMVKLLKKARERGYQVIAEFVKFEGGPMEIEWLEEYLEVTEEELTANQ